MPELPEVEIAARRLRETVPGLEIEAVEIPDPQILQTGTAAEWQERLPGTHFRAVGRRAKYLLLELSSEETIVAHLRMTGKLVVEARESVGRPRFIAWLTGGRRLAFHDPRRLGQLWRRPTRALETTPELAPLGPDALEAPSSAARLREIAAGSRRSIKAWLMDQRVIGGLGNICAAEILFRVGLAPETRAGDLAPHEWERLASAIPAYLQWAIAAQWEGELKYLGERDAENPFALYRRAGAPCPRCGALIERRVIAGRGTYVCPACQPVP